MAILRVKAGPEKGKIYELREQNVLLGRDRSAHIQILDQGASRQHAEVFNIRDLYFIRDLASRNRTFVNSEEIHEIVLRYGDQIQIGSTVLVFEDRLDRFKDSGEIVIDDRDVATGHRPSSTLQLRMTDLYPGSGDDEDASPESRRLGALLAISHIVGSERNLSDILSQAAAHLGKVVDADNVFIFKISDIEAGGENGNPPRHSEFELLGRHDRSDEVRNEGVSRTIMRDCLGQGRAILTSDAGLDARYNTMASVVLKKIKSVICVPITGLGRNIGVLYVSNSHRPEAFNSEDLELASAVGVLLATTIQLLQQIHESESTFRNSIRTLVAAIEMRDPRQKGRAERLASVCLATARELGWNTHQLRNAWLAGMLYDIGSIPLSDRDLEARFKLEPRKNHYAEVLLKEMPHLEEILPAVTQQNERWDGSGSPEGKSGDEIAPLARVLGLARQFDTILSAEGSDSPPPSEKDALVKITELAGKTFSEEVVRALVTAYKRGDLFSQDVRFFELP